MTVTGKVPISISIVQSRKSVCAEMLCSSHPHPDASLVRPAGATTADGVCLFALFDMSNVYPGVAAVHRGMSE